MTLEKTSRSPSDFEIGTLVSQINDERFRSWYRERQFIQNIRDGKSYFNGPSSTPPPSRHIPSQLLSCHRKLYYKHHNAPKETPDPSGIFWFGTQFETEIAVPFLQHLTGENQYVQNSIWTDFSIKVEGRELEFRGETDPVFVDSDGIPHLLTEIKTTKSFAHLDAPKLHHKAQAHAYLYGLSEKFDQELRDAIIIYAKRDDLDFRAFSIQFDPEFWESQVLAWALQNTRSRDYQELPAADPEFDWECDFCSYRGRCGQTDDPHSDVNPVGFLPLTHYPRKHVEAYLQSHPTAKLTPALADQYPDLVAEYGVYPWHCQVCGDSHSTEMIDWEGQLSEPPHCPTCRSNGIPSPMTGPEPEEQIQSPDNERDH